MANEVVRRLTISATSTGIDEQTGKLNKLADASNSLATVTDTNAKRALSADAAWTKLHQSLDPVAKSQNAIEKGTRTLNDALAQGLITQEKYNANLALLKEKYGEVGAANDNAKEGFNKTGIEAASVANHLKQAAEAAYVLSPAFRGLVNAGVTTGVAAIGTAAAATTVGIQGLGTAAVAGAASIARLGPAFAPIAGAVTTAGTAMAGFTGFTGLAGAATLTLTGRLLSFLAVMLRMAGPILLVLDAVKLIEFAWSSAGEKLEQYSNISKDALSVGVTPEYMQRVGKSFEDAGGKISDATDLLKKFYSVSTDKLGGSDLQKKIDAHIDVGNLDTNTGVDKFSDAIGTEAKYRAVLDLLKQMTDEGKKLAALDIAATFASPDQLEAFRQNSDYFLQMQESADKIAATKLVNQKDIDDATALKNRYDDAVKILSERWIPFQDTITAGGMALHRAWVTIVEDIAAALSGLERFANKISSIEIPGWLKTAWSSSVNALTPAAFKIAGQVGGAVSDHLNGPAPTTSSYPAGFTSGLSNPNSVAAARTQTTGISDFLRKDSSNEIKQATQATQEYNDAVDRAINSLQKHVLQQDADAKAVGLGAGELAKFRAEAAETAAVLANGGKETEDQVAKFTKLKEAAASAADALARAQVASDIKRGQQLAFASPEDVKIANQLQKVYGDDIPAALNSSEAAAIRMNDTMKSIGDSVRQMAGAFANDFVGALKSGKSVMDSLGASMKNLSSSLMSGGINALMSGNYVQGGIEIGASLLTSLFGGDDEEEKKRQEAEQKRQQQIQANRDAQAQRQADFTLQAQLAGINTNTTAGQIQAFDLQANKQRADEMKAGGFAIVELEKSLAAQRQSIVDKANQAVIKSYQDFLDSVKTGSLSTLSPEDQLKYAQSAFNSDAAKAATGDQDAISKVTNDAQTLLQLAKAFYASSTGYGDIYKTVIDTVNGLMNSSLYKATTDTGIINAADSDPDPQGTAMRERMAKFASGDYSGISDLYGSVTGYAGGGVVSNGIRGVDSVTAKLAGGEHVTKASSVNASTIGALSYINQTGRPPRNDNSEVVRVLTQGFNGLASSLSDKLDNVADRIKRLEETTRQTSNQRRVPGSTQKAA
ncbi:hypothetical protein [Bradyrhizobium sp. SSUT77]|uniref:hypothetical protein n=1 Tax=Bradyrhizobium sp. SSUT77 TaxID=3040603 RepID=UPI002448BA8E|nr:hypothetical protein [Bradyrhizobium sp. SSUT77]MDH2341539.1 hypothetical protein [Bradyrhizobium sp. SSUT77]